MKKDVSLFWRIRKSGESRISSPWRYHLTCRGGLPRTRHSRTTTWPSDAWASCNSCTEKGSNKGEEIRRSEWMMMRKWEEPGTGNENDKSASELQFGTDGDERDENLSQNRHQVQFLYLLFLAPQCAIHSRKHLKNKMSSHSLTSHAISLEGNHIITLCWLSFG